MEREDERVRGSHEASGHDATHHHGEACGHRSISHEGHTDYVVDGRLHHPHDGHCDDRGVPGGGP